VQAHGTEDRAAHAAPPARAHDDEAAVACLVQQGAVRVADGQPLRHREAGKGRLPPVDGVAQYPPVSLGQVVERVRQLAQPVHAQDDGPPGVHGDHADVALFGGDQGVPHGERGTFGAVDTDHHRTGLGIGPVAGRDHRDRAGGEHRHLSADPAQAEAGQVVALTGPEYQQVAVFGRVEQSGDRTARHDGAGGQDRGCQLSGLCDQSGQDVLGFGVQPVGPPGSGGLGVQQVQDGAAAGGFSQGPPYGRNTGRRAIHTHDYAVAGHRAPPHDSRLTHPGWVA
jgi:hypothetical protein